MTASLRHGMVRYVMQGPECRDACGVSWMQVGVKAEKFVCTGQL
jgi:hypothetical protein